MTNPTGQHPGFWQRLQPIQRVGLILAAPLVLCCGGAAAIGILADDPDPVREPAARQLAEAVATTEPTGTGPAATAPAVTASAGPAASVETVAPTATSRIPVTTKRTVTERRAVTFTTRTVRDDSLPEGEREVRTEGVAGVRTLTYEVTYVDGRQTGRKLLRSVVTRRPVTRVVVIGTGSDSGGDCHPDYRPCVPIASDVDCAGGSGDGPEYVSGPVRVVGGDPYDLDRDGDGTACD